MVRSRCPDDVEFPEAVRTCALNGAALVLVPTANFHPYSFANDPIIRVRAFESHVHVIYANWSEHVNEDGVHFNGQSVCASPQGEPLMMLAPVSVCASSDRAPPPKLSC